MRKCRLFFSLIFFFFLVGIFLVLGKANPARSACSGAVECCDIGYYCYVGGNLTNESCSVCGGACAGGLGNCVCEPNCGLTGPVGAVIDGTCGGTISCWYSCPEGTTLFASYCTGGTGATPTPAPGTTPAPTSNPNPTPTPFNGCQCTEVKGTVCGEGDCGCPDYRITKTCRTAYTNELCWSRITYSCTNTCQLTGFQNEDIKWHRSNPAAAVELVWDTVGCARNISWKIGYNTGSTTDCNTSDDFTDPNCITGTYDVNDYSCNTERIQSYAKSNFLPNTLYRLRIKGDVPKYGDVCTKLGSVRSVSSCDLPDITMNVGEVKPLTSLLNCDALGGIYRVRYVVENGYPGKISFTDFPTDPDGQRNVTSCPYAINLTANKIGSVAITGYVDLTDNGQDDWDCSSTATITILQPASSAWWQVKDADVITRGQLLTRALSAYKFDLLGDGGYPGVPWFGTTDLIKDTVSDTGWLAQSNYSSSRVFNSSYFFNALPSSTQVNNINENLIEGITLNTGGTMDASGYYYYIYDGSSLPDTPFTINSGVALGTRKVVLFVKNTDVNIKGTINVQKGSGFFMVVADGDIIVDPSVGIEGLNPDLEGVYIADGSFSSGSDGAGNDNRLWIRGTVVSGSGVAMERDRGVDNDTYPSELIEFAADQELLFPKDLSYTPRKWQEVAP